MERIEKHGKELRNEFNNTFLSVKKDLRKKYNNEIKIKNIRNSPEIGMSTYYGIFSNFNIVEVNWWQIIHKKIIVCNISTMYEIKGDFFEIDID